MFKKDSKALFISFLLITVFISCHSIDKLDQALSLAEENRSELEKVLEYYKNDPNPLKLKAAIFLIENMPGHRSYIGDEIENYYKELESIINTDTTVDVKNEEIKKMARNYSKVSFQEEDIKIVTADYLVRNIDQAFDLWKRERLVGQVNFEQFCELLLPYKCFEYQQLDAWRDTLSIRFNRKLKAKLDYDQSNNSSYFVATQINGDISDSFSGTKEAETKKPLGLPFLNSSIYKVAYEDCFGSALLATMVLRSHGIPVAMDYIPQWEGKGGAHAWYTLLSDNGTFLPFSFGLTSNPGDIFFPYESIPKVYRVTYSANEKIARYFHDAVYKHPLFDLFEKDVTNEYTQTSDLSVQLLNFRLKDKYVYLSVFDSQSWNVVDLGIQSNGWAEFECVGRGIVYLVLGYDGRTLVPISDPFLVEKNGDLKYFIADTINKRDVCLQRKYPRSIAVADIEYRMVGAEIQASNDKDFSQYELLYKIKEFSYPDLIKLNPSQKYRYWRYLSGRNTYCNIAELQFFEEGKDCIAHGDIIGTDNIYQNNPDMVREKAFDRDYLTFFHSEQPDGAWVGLDMGKAVVIDRVRCLPRSDDNAIHDGDVYELQYWDRTGWKSLGINKAKGKYLSFGLVPDNVLLLLSNRTRGRQERIFTFENGRQVWW
ncbi:discoidin domain-containing protein [Parabacteroides faecis]|uniref:discoidin domain-containing protein n=2 Tax=Parabacteroides faecis TaxID=1217282 RepID=UPI0021648590|nr:discoidin domain-containing protein [Parabacteroides faecis]UVQ47376.1 discoidin domain-containing protein [Parabacteroides faecis]